MKIIVSHDIDHMTAWEHKNALIPKFLARATIELYKGVISFTEYQLRFKSVFLENKWQNLEEIMLFNKNNNIPSAFFIGVSNGMDLEYPLKKAFFWADRIKENGFDVGVHGIAYSDLDAMKQEFSLLANHVGSQMGIRMHYLRNDQQTFNHLSEMGYLFDSTHLIDENPYKIGNMWEFPLHIMESHIFYQDGKRHTSETLDEYKEITKQRISELEKKGIEYMTLLFHDRYFEDGFLIWKEWYIWVVEYLRDQGHVFVSYKDAITELENA